MANTDSITDMLPIYYKRLFPYEPYFRWLTYGEAETKEKKSKYLQNREFSFAMEEDIIIRYMSFESQEDFEKTVQKRCPHKIDVGAIYTLPPKTNRTRPDFHPVEKEMVFDIDMTDYDEVRTCCKDAVVCKKCWRFMSVACKILDKAIEEDFGWKHRLWVFSGRRGIHCWICDESARKLDASQRAACAEYLQLLAGGDNQAKKVLLSGQIHPSVKRAIKIVEEKFVEIMMKDQQILDTEKGCAHFLKMITDDELKGMVEKEFKNVKTSVERWNAFKKMADFYNLQDSKSSWKTKHIIHEIMLEYNYPRLDINVSKGFNHLLKSPFCVHPKTGKVCVPFSPKTVDSFDPDKVPTIHVLLDEVAKYDKEEQEHNVNESSRSKVKDYKKGSLNKSVLIFEQFLKPMEVEWRNKHKENIRQKKELEF